MPLPNQVLYPATDVYPGSPPLDTGWRFVLTQLNGTQVGEITQAVERRVEIPLNRLATASFRVRLDNPLADAILQMDGLIKAYRGITLAYVGMILSCEETTGEGGSESGQIPTLQVNTISPAWRLTKRMVGKSTGPTHPGITYGTAAAPMDKSEVMKQMIDTANVAPSGTLRTGVRVGARQSSSTSIVGPVNFKPVLEQMTEMLGSVDAPEIEFAPIEPTGTWPNTAVCEFRSYYPRMGVDRPNAVFEYGVGKHNVLNYKRPITMEGLLNQAYVLPEGFPDTTSLVKVSTDPPSAENRVWNPSFETNTTRWTATAATLARVTTTGQSGPSSGRLTATATSGVYAQTSTVNGEKIPVTPSTPWTASAWVKNATALRKASIDILWYNSSNTLLSTTTGSYFNKAQNLWERVYTTATTPSTAAFAVLRIRTNGGSTANGEISYLDAVQMENNTVPATYFDGSSPGASWAGTAHNSQSLVTPLDVRGLYEEVIQTDVTPDTYRQSLADEHVRLRKGARQLIEIEPVINADVQPFEDYYIGDSVIARAIVGEYVRFDGWLRVYGINFEIDDVGNEKYTLELVMPDL